MHKGQGIKEHKSNPSVPAGYWATGRGRQGGWKTCGQQRQSEGGRYPQTGEPLGMTWTWVRSRTSKGGNQTRDGSHRLARGTLCGRPAREISETERWRPVGGGAVQVDGRSAPRREGGGGVQIDSEAALKGERWGGDSS